MTFSSIFDQNSIQNTTNNLTSISSTDIENLLQKKTYTINDFAKLISPAATPFLEEIATQSQQLTIQRFGKTIQLYIPLYLSNVCENQCTYCGFNQSAKIPRLTLTPDQAIKEALILKSKGFQHILLLTGESPKTITTPYLKTIIEKLSPHFSSIGLEVYPMETSEYQTLVKAGADSLTLYQETYHKEAYEQVHLKGKKADYQNRLNSIDRAGKAEFYRINIGALLGLYQWQYEALSLASHVHYLQKKYWKTKFSISLPRIQEMGLNFKSPNTVTDKDLVQFICAFRLVFPDLGITLSTREPETLRNNLIPLGITTISAESHTAPGGYSGQNKSNQFEIADTRSLKDIQKFLQKIGYDTVMKDWY